MIGRRKSYLVSTARLVCRFGMLLVCLLVAVLSSVRADIAPMPCPGYTLTPAVETRVRMERETVDIYIGDRVSKDNYTRLARVVASFEMSNESSDTVSLNVGFPVETWFIGRAGWRDSIPPDADEMMAEDAKKEYADRGVYDFQVSVNGGESFEPDFAKAEGKLARGARIDYLWFGWQMEFPPGVTPVTVSYHVPSVYSNARAYQNVGYVLYSGSFWKDTIGHAAVTVHFPEGVANVVPGPVTTAGYRLEAGSISWEYYEFEPGPFDNICFEYLPFAVSRKIAALEKQVEEHRRDASARLELARLYLHVAGRGPERQAYPDYARKAESLLKETLVMEPANALAWNVYLLNYHRMHENTFGLGSYQRFGVSRAQRNLIYNAKRKCPDDESIQAWHDLITPTAWELPDTLGYLNPKVFSTEISFSRSFGHGTHEVSKEDVKVIGECYRFLPVYRSNSKRLVINENLSQKDKLRVAVVLEKYRYFSSVYVRQIRSYYDKLQRGYSVVE